MVAAPQAGWFFPEGMELYAEWDLGINVPLDDLAVDYVAAIEKPFLDESCVAGMKAAGKNWLLCWDASTHYQYVCCLLYTSPSPRDRG